MSLLKPQTIGEALRFFVIFGVVGLVVVFVVATYLTVTH